jgi:hypothetical protein
MMFTSVLAGLALTQAAAAPAQLVTGDVKARAVEAAMFKNGYSVLIRGIDIPRSGRFRLREIPQASLGTLWFWTTDGVQIRAIRNTSSDGPKVVTNLIGIPAILSANVGKVVRLGLREGDEVTGKQITGKLLAFGGNQAVIESNGRVLTFLPGMISSVSAAKGVLQLRVTSPTKVRGLEFQVAAERPGVIYMISLERGLLWSPSYAVDLVSDKELRLTATCTVVNDLEDLNVREARFVTGFPNLAYAFTPHPLTTSPSVEAFVTNMSQTGTGMPGGFGGGGFGGAGGGRMMTQNAAAPMADFNPGSAMPVSPVAGTQLEDLFFYRQPQLFVRKGDRSFFNLFTMKSDYRELYTWDVVDTDADSTYRAIAPVESQEFWHTVRFKNTSGQPFTTGPAATYRQNNLLGQDSILYTPTGAELELKVTKALNIRPDILEEETERQRNALQHPHRGVFDKVTVRGTIRIVNTKAEEVELRIRKRITGEVKSTQEEPKVTKVATGLRAVNPQSRLEWTLKLKPGEERVFTYTYEVFLQG